MLTVGDDTSTPIEGAGHNYIKSLSETVNPANGSVSLRIALPIPKGRGIMLPFTINYDSNGIVNLSAPSATPSWYSPMQGSDFQSSGGWNYGLPVLTSREWTKTLYDGGTQGNKTVTCTFRAGYMFRDPLGGRHSFYLGNSGYQSGSNNQVRCGSQYISSVDPQFAARFTVTPSGISSGLLTPVVISDNDGTRYYFPGFDNQELPAYIEDRNGNTITLSPEPAGYTGPITVTDTVGRTVLSSSGFGSGTTTLTTPDQQYSVVWSSNSASYTIPSTLIKNNIPPGDTSHACAPIDTSVNADGNVISSVSLPNTQKYKFYYGTNPNSAYNNPYGLLSEIDSPSGGWVKYTWKLSDNPNQPVIYDAICTPGVSGCRPLANACQAEYQSPVIATRTVGFGGTSPDEVDSFVYNTVWNTSGTILGWDSKSTSITTTDKIRNQSKLTHHTYGSVAGTSSPYVEYQVAQEIPVETQIQSYDWGNTTSPVRTVNKTWQNQYLLTSAQTVLNDASNLSSNIVYSYGANSQLQELDEYDYGVTALSRKTITNHQSFTANSLLEGRIVDKPCQTVVYDGSGTRVSETDYFYDNGSVSTPCGTAGTPVVAAVSGLLASTHDETNYGVSSLIARGNLTQETRWSNSGSSPTTTYTYDETGQVLSKNDPCGNVACSDMTGTSHTTTFSYADSYDSPPSWNTNTYLTQVTNPLGQISKFKYAYSDAQLLQSQDQNDINASLAGTTYTYNDSLRRPTEVDYSDGGKTTISYNDTPSTPTITTSNLMNTSGQYVTTVTTFDGMNHIVQTELTSDPDGATYTAKSYDGLGELYNSWNPTRCSPPTTNCGTESTWGSTTYTYDGLGRSIKVTHPDGTFSTTTYLGRATDVVDEGNGTYNGERISQVDAFGHMTYVCEVTSSPQLGSGGTPAACGLDINKTGFLTTYNYDILDNLLSVAQGSMGQRTFAYDSLSRLLCAANPETGGTATCPSPDNGTYTAGTTRYSYDANGNVASRLRPAPNQTNGTVTVATSYLYDVLNRLTEGSYSDGVTPTALFGYDQTSITMGTQQFNITNSIGRLSWECTISGGGCPTMNAFSYDPLGRIGQLWTSWQHVSGINIVLTYDYDLLGDEADYYMGTVPRGSTELVSTYSGAGRLTSYTTPTLVDATNPANLLTGVHYDPFGHVISGTLANGLSQSSAFDPRSRVTAMAVGTTCSSGNCSTNKYRFTTSYAPNSDILSSTDTVNGNWTYTYDSLNRLSTAVANNGQGCSWDYDRYGNRWHQNTHSGNCTAPQYSFSGNNNRLDGYSYDVAGNLLNDGSHNYLYDAENRIVSVDGGATTYVYDAEGRRFSKTTPSNTVATVYDREGRPLVRSNFAPGELYAAGMHLGTYVVNSGHTDTIFYYDHSDWLGTERARTDLTGTPCETITSLPFGDNQTITSTCGDLSPLHFTGKERDAESNLDNFGARYFTSAMGRFMTPDWAARPTAVPYAVFGDPQSLNLYAYVRNDPVTVADADGHTLWKGNPSADRECRDDLGCVSPCAVAQILKTALQDESTRVTLAAQNTYKSKDAAASAAVEDMRKRENGYKWEYGARIHKNGKTYTYGPVVTDKSGTGVNLPGVQKDDVGDVHTHNYGVGDDAHANSIEYPDKASTVTDKAAVQKLNSGAKIDYDSYVGAPNGNLLKFTPNPSAPDGWGDTRVVERGVAPDPSPPQ